jgi:hypothetical protein
MQNSVNGKYWSIKNNQDRPLWVTGSADLRNSHILISTLRIVALVNTAMNLPMNARVT